eukprot:TRINITY_DN5107_c0_g1_i1.p1 TRINITY_DN5107_c0_g1~~TRINITY_DN5107_c0_g1_i1.p1  ORF type:complete len:603 (-),score=177.69 TRINITY_DN5107_c0_g1_i1:12-1790(-)
MHMKKSKRVPLAKKHKIERKVREHKRRTRREAKKTGNKKMSKDPGIPNLWPFKDELLHQIEARKERAKLLQQQQKEKRAKELAKRRGMDGLQQDAEARAADFEAEHGDADQNSDGYASDTVTRDNSRRQYYRDFKKLTEQADVILEVLDARDPIGCRSKAVEEAIMRRYPDKRFILVLNKIDLVPKENAEQWLSFFRQDLPTVLFKSSTQSQKNHLGQSATKATQAREDQLDSKECIGASALITILKNYCRNKNIKTAIRVGVIGFPNVGKSSIINSLMRQRAVQAGSTPGLTKNLQEVHLDKHIILLDSPGIVFSAKGTSVDADIILRNCVNVNAIADLHAPIIKIIERCGAEQLMLLYELPAFSSVAEFLLHIAHKRHMLLKGGIADLDGAAKSVLHDWNGGKIRFFTQPPARPPTQHLGAQVVHSWSAEFNIDALVAEEKEALSQIKQQQAHSKFVSMAPGATDDVDAEALFVDPAEEGGFEDVEDDDADGEMQDDDAFAAAAAAATAAPSVQLMAKPLKSDKSTAKKRAAFTVAQQKQIMFGDNEDKFNPQLNRTLKKAQKKTKKMGAKAAAFDFATDFVATNDKMQD